MFLPKLSLYSHATSACQKVIGKEVFTGMISLVFS